ncbi:IS5 family transposase [Achromobacter deleyi]|uniref:IS5 family transposase n=1 Tax=Achromobacter deleyi TaxID=1353891 RepID=UPI001E308761|nr:IS5 family transposase [Achromobacter deleyi]
MSQLSFSDAEYAGKRKQTRREKFLSEMERAIPWKVFAELVEPHYLKSGNGRRPYALETMLRIHFMQQWFSLSDPAMEEALYDIASMRRFAKLSLSRGSIRDETTILNFRHLLEKHELAADALEAVNLLLQDQGLQVRRGTMVDASIIEAPSSTKNASGTRDPEMHQTKKGNTWHFGMKAHIGVDLHSGLVHTVVGTAANVNDVTQAHALLHGQEELVLGDAGYQGVHKRAENLGREVQWHIAMRPGDRRRLGQGKQDRMQETYERCKAGLRPRVEHPFRVIKRQFGYTKVRYRGLFKNTAQLKMLFALSNIWLARRHLMAAAG